VVCFGLWQALDVNVPHLANSEPALITARFNSIAVGPAVCSFRYLVPGRVLPHTRPTASWLFDSAGTRRVAKNTVRDGLCQFYNGYSFFDRMSPPGGAIGIAAAAIAVFGQPVFAPLYVPESCTCAWRLPSSTEYPGGGPAVHRFCHFLALLLSYFEPSGGQL